MSFEFSSITCHWNQFSEQGLHNVGFISCACLDHVWSFPLVYKFTISCVLFPNICLFQHKVTQLETLRFDHPVVLGGDRLVYDDSYEGNRGCYFFLEVYLFPNGLHVIFFWQGVFGLPTEFYHFDWYDDFCLISKFEWGFSYCPMWCGSLCPKNMR